LGTSSEQDAHTTRMRAIVDMHHSGSAWLSYRKTDVLNLLSSLK